MFELWFSKDLIITCGALALSSTVQLLHYGPGLISVKNRNGYPSTGQKVR